MKIEQILTNIATLGVIGKSPYAPGTCGSLAALALAPFVFMPFGFLTRLIILIVLFLIGIYVSNIAEVVLAKKDPSSVVIDEVVGQWIVLLPFAVLSFWEYILAFVLFRIFDIWKPFPIGRIETSFSGGMGIMLDDIVAGIYALIFFWLIRMLVN